jgi:fumarylacetoacetate (FAA) hydrolase
MRRCRAYQWADGSAYSTMSSWCARRAAAKMPASFWMSPLMYQGGSDSFAPPPAPIDTLTEDWGID